MTETPDVRARRRAARRGRALRRAAFVESRIGEVDRAAVEDAAGRRLAPAPAEARRELFPVDDERRWVPVGPSVVRRGQAENRPRVTGRIRDLQVDGTGTRAYAASAKGGVWYTDDAGATWDPVGGWADRDARAGGSNNAQSCGCLLVSFGADAAHDFVMVGTGETTPWRTPAPTGHGRFGGLGVLAAGGPADVPVGTNPWEQEAGLAQLEGLGVFRLARDPAAVAGQVAAPGTDRVLAATSAGLFLGTRRHVAGPPAHDEFGWGAVPALGPLVGLAAPAQPTVTDVLWLPGGTADGRIVVAVRGEGVAFSDDLGAHFDWVSGLDPSVPIDGRMSLAQAADRIYVLGERSPTTPTLWQIPDMGLAAPAATVVPGVHADLWGTQRDYDQAVAVDVVGAVDRVYIGGSTFFPPGGTNWNASLWCYDVHAGPALAPASGVSRTGAPPAGDGADQDGLVGNNVHADVHTIRLTGPAGPGRQVWVGCDGGVFVSAQAGRVNSYASRSTGMAVLEVGFVATHPTSSHFLAVGCQDNGTQVRVGDTVWEETIQADGGGLAFHPILSQFLVAQQNEGQWQGRPPAAYRGPLRRSVGGNDENTAPDREYDASAFYSGIGTMQFSPSVARMSVGTTRVWVTNDLGTAWPNSWRVLPYPNGASSDPRPGGGDPFAQRNVGVPAGGPLAAIAAGAGIGPLGPVITMRWSSAHDLVVMFARGVVRWTQNPATDAWTATPLVPGTLGAPNPATTVLTDVFPVTGTDDFYLTCTGDTAVPPGDTCWYYHAATHTFHPTDLRHELDDPPTTPLGPLDPAYAVTVDPAATTDVYVGTITGVWRGVRQAGPPAGGPPPPAWPHDWEPMVNGLPQATVQDLSIWHDPDDAAAPRLLRAAIQSRGVWEVDLAAPAEPVRTYLRVQQRDDRRRFPTPMENPRRRPTAPHERPYASPDIVIRPRLDPGPPAPAPPVWRLRGGSIHAGNVVTYQLWTFQTAFRWLYPSVAADGRWTDAFGDLVELHRSILGLSMGPAARVVDRDLWDAVVGGTHLDATGAVTASNADPLAVYRAPWQTPDALDAVATEIDVVENVVPPGVRSDAWQVYAEPSTVDVLVHHRDTRPLAVDDAFAMLLWRSAPGYASLLAADATDLPAFVTQVVAGAAPPEPAGWNLARTAGGAALHRLDARLSARVPRAVPIDVDLSAVRPRHRVLLLAVVGSGVGGVGDPLHDPCTAAPVNLPANPTVVDLARRWPYAALRLLRVWRRPT